MHNEKPIKVSIIIPVYNVQKYIYECIQSVVNQSYKNLEIIIVNDGTRDHSIDIIQNFICNDKRIKLINKENGGLFAARVDGIHNATGNYILFVDADDWIDLNFVSEAVEFIQNDDIDYVKTRKIVESQNKSYILATAKETWIVNSDDFPKKLYPQLITTTLYNQIPGQLIKKNCFNLKELDYIKETMRINYAEDMLFNIILLPNLSKYVYLKQAHYHYRQNQSSITKTVSTKNLKDNTVDCIFVYSYLIKFFKDLGQDYYIEESYNRYLIELINCVYKYLYYSKETVNEKIKYLKELYNIQKTQEALNNFNRNSPYIKKMNKKHLLRAFEKKQFKLCIQMVNIIRMIHIKKRG